ncbi:TetR family transcriptional regulator [Nocardioides sp. zg-536]|uniref:TetR family transcriptional regulator n=1 Tax=Nocardioides faecalis TaxID=2803858 RepID=A0A939BVF3_9ACTN|nr:TetR family transcriptional regulator [Nocardioides faecalis]MBM9459881.1 TetR family transcriptional regulator [Nocardioides faecalis]MBS4754512.1 TetR family transcriptional regulator [Nocardioides faecalis]QVI58884.1 TetR family transcriptional regulator [Nocardioides faecalis]
MPILAQPGADPDLPPEAPATTLREKLVEAAVRRMTREGWGKVTMARLADDVGVSRQTVYNEIGTKTDLAEAMVLRELDRFLAGVTRSFDENPTDLIGALRDSARRVLKYARDNALLHAVVSATHGADTELLPLLTTHSESLLDAAKAVVGERVVDYRVDLPPERLQASIDMVVRLVLSHVMQPSGDPAETAEGIAWIAARVLR